MGVQDMGRHTQEAASERVGKHSEDTTGNRAIPAVETQGGAHRTEDEAGTLPSGTPLVR